MDRPSLYAHLVESPMLKEWHWFRWHFERSLRGPEHPLCKSFVDACLDCERVIPGFAVGIVDRMASIGGREKFEPHFEQLLQLLSEIHVIKQVLTFDWGSSETKFQWEPRPRLGKKNPELLIEQSQLAIGIEVKCPALRDHIRKRSTNPIQLPARSDALRSAAQNLRKPTDDVTLPRDNPVKDFLISADEKFAPFKRENPDFVGVLVIVWDDFIYEPLTALLSDLSGLFTKNSFHTDAAGLPARFENVDGVVLIRHLHQIDRAASDKPLTDGCRHALDYGEANTFPYKVLVQNPNGRLVPDALQRCLQTRTPSADLGAEYVPQDMIFWLNV
jgi:hypothetical protein